MRCRALACLCLWLDGCQAFLPCTQPFPCLSNALMSSGGQAPTSVIDTSKYTQQLPNPKEDWAQLHKGLVACLKAGDGHGALALYDTVRERGYSSRMPHHVYNGIINLCSDTSLVGRGRRVMDHMKEAGHPLAENSYAFLIRECTSRGACLEAMEVISGMVAQGITPRLRSFAPIMEGFCHQAAMEEAEECWLLMKAQGVVPSVELYCTYIMGLAGAGMLWDAVAAGEVGTLLLELSYQVCELEEKVLYMLADAFNEGLDIPIAQVVNMGGDVANEASMHAATTEKTAEAIDCAGCPVCGQELAAVGLTTAEKEKLRAGVKKLVTERARTARLKRSKYGEGDSASAELEDFIGWLELKHAEGCQYTAIIDAPNVAYFGQNCLGGSFQIAQIDQVVLALQREGEKPLVVCPARYLKKEVPNTTRFAKQGKNKWTVLSPEALLVIDRWHNEGLLYVCSDSVNDDWYWMYASVAFDDAPCNVISNDLMRDHRLALLEPTPFRRWKATQMRRYGFRWDLTKPAGQETDPDTQPEDEQEHLAPVLELEQGPVGASTPPPSSEPPEVMLQGKPFYTRDLQGKYGVWHLPLAAATAAAEGVGCAKEEVEDARDGSGDAEGEAPGKRGGGGRFMLEDTRAPPGDWLCLDLGWGLRLRGLAEGSGMPGN
ncbi:unnamed protein product [Chrysoparadoxa australica]